MTAGGYGTAWPTDADRANVHVILNRAYAEGRLSQPDFQARSAQAAGAQTYDQLARLTADLGGPPPGPPAPPGPGWGAPPPGPGWGAPPPGYGPMGYPVRPTNQLAIASLVCACAQVFFWFLTGIPAVILGHIARRQIRQTGENGDGMALTGMILGYAGIVLGVIITVLVIIGITAAVHDQNVINGCGSTSVNC
jgi:hypothetical protein